MSDKSPSCEAANVNASPFGTELRRIRRQAGLTLVDLAEAAGCSVVYVSQIERGEKAPPSPSQISAMLVRVGCPERTDEMLLLAARSRRAVEFSLKDNTSVAADMILALKRETEDAGGIDPDLAQQILDLLKSKKGRK